MNPRPRNNATGKGITQRKEALATRHAGRKEGYHTAEYGHGDHRGGGDYFEGK